MALELKRIKAEYGDVAVKAAWKLLPPSERDGREVNRLRHRIKAICDLEPQPTLAPQQTPVVETPEAYQVNQSLQLEPQTRKSTLVELSVELEQIDSLLLNRQ